MLGDVRTRVSERKKRGKLRGMRQRRRKRKILVPVYVREGKTNEFKAWDLYRYKNIYIYKKKEKKKRTDSNSETVNFVISSRVNLIRTRFESAPWREEPSARASRE